MQENKNLCGVCGNAASQKCGRCMATYYCTREHQKSDWKKHAKICMPCKLVEDGKIGRHYVATSDIKVGEIVMRDEVPLVTGLHFEIRKKTLNGVAIKYVPPVCLNCYIELTIGNAKPCRKCGWPLCEICEKHGNECEFTVKYGKSKIRITKYEEHHPIYEAIGTIRALALKDTDPEAYRKLLNLKHHCEKIWSQPKVFMHHRQIAKMVKVAFNIEHIEEDEIFKVCGILRFNAFVIATPTNLHTAVYNAASYVEHSCRANCSRIVTDDECMVIWAAVPISKGDHITICYTDFNWGTVQRRDHLAMKFFECECERCKDPTEFGTMFNALKCFEQTCDGYMLPPSFLGTKGKYPDFVCSKCKMNMPGTEVQRTIAIIAKHAKRLDRTVISDCEKFIAKWKKVLHANHFLIFEVEAQLAIRIGLGGTFIEKSDKCLTDLAKLCKKLLNLIETLTPAGHRLRGALLFILLGANNALYTRNEPKKIDKSITYLKERKKMLDEIDQLFHHEPDSSSLKNSIASRIWDEMIEAGIRDAGTATELLQTFGVII